MIISVLVLCGSAAATSQSNSSTVTKNVTTTYSTSQLASYEGTSDTVDIRGCWINPSKTKLKDVNVSELKAAGIKDLFVLTNKNNVNGTLKPYIDKFSGSGFRIHAWITCFVDSNGNWYDPGTNTTLKNNLTKSIISIATNYDVNGIQLDYVRYPDDADKYNGTIHVTSFVKTIYNQIQSINNKKIPKKPKILLSAAVMPEPGASGPVYGQDYGQLAPYLDFMVPMVYKGNYKADTAWVGSVTKYIVGAAKGTPVVTGLQTYRSDNDPTPLKQSDLNLDIKTAMDNGSSGYVLFRYGLIDTSPYIVTADPKNKAVNLAYNKFFRFTFNENIKTGTAWIVLLNSASKPISFTTTINGKVLTIKPKSNLAESRYKLTLHTGSVTDLTGNPLALIGYSFSVGKPPGIKSANPKNGALNVPVSKTIKLTFNENIKKGNGWIELKKAGKAVSYTSSISGKVLTINPKSNLAESLYTLGIHTGSVTDMAGNPVALKSFKFSAGAPKVTRTNPAKSATKISLTLPITINFAVNIKSSSKYSGIYIKNLSTGKKVAITKAIKGKVLKLKMTYKRLNRNTYQVYIPARAVKDLYGSTLASAYTFKFKTA